jgi:DNA-binding MarR family transcriptional regulator
MLQRMDNATPARIAKMLGISRQLAAYHLSRLEEQGLALRQGGRYRVVEGSRDPPA